MTQRYMIGAYLNQMSELLGLSPERVLRRAGLSGALAQSAEISVPAETYLRLWDAMCDEADRPGIEMELAMIYAHGPFIPPIFAFSCAETLELGLRRLSDFKPLVGPLRMVVQTTEDGLFVSLGPSDAGLQVSPSLGLFEILYITECARTFTGAQVTPVASTLPGDPPHDMMSLEYLGRAPHVGSEVSLTFSHEDAARSLITRSASLWETLEPGFREQLETQTRDVTLTERVKHALEEALPGGSTTVEDMARRLNLSKRSLQRRLREEGTSFQDVLSATRFAMSERYLKDGGLSLPEISYLLGFRETSSFFRAFQGWTGRTPGEYRSDGLDLSNRA